MICLELIDAFGATVSYNRFLELMQEVTVPLLLFVALARKGKVSGIAFVDSMAIKVCHPARISAHKTFKNLAQRGKTSVGWFYGFKLHLIINHVGEIISFWITPGNVADNNVTVLDRLTKGLWGKLFGYRGYISEDLFTCLLKRCIKLFTRIRKNMRNKLITLWDKFLLSNRGVIESTNNLLKNSCQIEHSRHRSVTNFFVNFVAGLATYSFRENKPSINIKSFRLLEAIS